MEQCGTKWVSIITTPLLKGSRGSLQQCSVLSGCQSSVNLLTQSSKKSWPCGGGGGVHPSLNW